MDLDNEQEVAAVMDDALARLARGCAPVAEMLALAAGAAYAGRQFLDRWLDDGEDRFDLESKHDELAAWLELLEVSQ